MARSSLESGSRRGSSNRIAALFASSLVVGAAAASHAAPATKAAVPPVKILPPSHVPVLPPLGPWEGKSQAFVVSREDPWVTPFESSGLLCTPRYDETMAWLRRLSDASPDLEMVSLGKSPEGRDIWMVVATRAGGFTPEAVRAARKPIVFAQAGIHSGEIDGKDAGMMLLRDLGAGRRLADLLDRASFLFVPILNVDGHERSSPYSRINQRGPEEAGWRTTARNLNINRDWPKLDAPETRAVVQALDRWDPDLWLDLHVTDGADYQYDVTFGWNGPHAWSPASAAWLDRVLGPALRADLETAGHLPGPLVWPLDEREPASGILDATADPRYSTGYGDARHLPTVLVENHSLKPFGQRVLGTYVLLESVLRTVGREGAVLRRALEKDRARHPERVALAWRVPENPAPRTIDLLGIESRRVPSALSGGIRIEWTGKPVTMRVPVVTQSEPTVTVVRPRAYWIPPAWADVAERLAQHGIRVERIDTPREVDGEMCRIASFELGTEPFEGRVRVTPEVAVERRLQRFPAGSFRVPTDQPLGDLAVLLLEPESPDSFFQWGFFHEVLQQAEYVESYVMEPTAEQMMAADPALRAAFEQKLLDDAAFAGDARARLQWFYRQTPFYDATARLYPVARELRSGDGASR